MVRDACEVRTRLRSLQARVQSPARLGCAQAATRADQRRREACDRRWSDRQPQWEQAAVNWLQRWLERRRALKVVSWDACAWSPKKFAEKRFTQHMVEQYQQIARIQLDAVQKSML